MTGTAGQLHWDRLQISNHYRGTRKYNQTNTAREAMTRGMCGMPHLQSLGDVSAVSREQYLPFKPEDLSVNSPNARESGTRSEDCDVSVPVVR